MDGRPACKPEISNLDRSVSWEEVMKPEISNLDRSVSWEEVRGTSASLKCEWLIV
ncbi:Uncharacterised protein [Chromobacterium violaceum]|uniref:Uncharacterized protein n=1 Tax=Chromobacterium violaceum TaxID=536 RepID=A0AAX2MGJ0_CHRVL|nr:Uncharacterised protein [Chromobacterium violaceum]SUY93074.1 Uncharacterised protein [Chromobacterium violaceum]